MKIRRIKKRRIRPKRLIRTAGWLLVLLGLLLVYSVKIEPNLLLVRHYQLQGETVGTETIRLAQISDIQIGENYSMKQLQRVVNKIEKQQPDIILFTGDLFENYAVCGAEAEAEVTALLGRLQAPLGKYAVWGNRDYGGGAARAYRRILDKAGFELLCNSSVQITAAEGKQVLLCGLDDGLFGAPDDAQFPQQMDTFAYRILLLHEPDLAQRWVQSDFQLILAGHSHGGQVRLPFGVGLRTVLAERYTRHFYTLNEETGQQLYVNTGLGTSHLPVRFGVVPEIAVFDITI